LNEDTALRTIHIPGVSLQPYLAAVATTTLAVLGLIAVYLFVPKTNVIDYSAVPQKSTPADATVSLSMAAAFDRHGYTLSNVRAGKVDVPRLNITSLPKDLLHVRDTQLKKSIFFRALLPLALQVNDQIKSERARLLSIRNEINDGKTLSSQDQAWLNALASKYKVKPETLPEKLGELVKRVDAIPVSLILAQAAKESGWGTSRFARQGNALFGQWTWNDDHKGIVPSQRGEGKTHRIRAFDSAKAAITAYALNLNTHRAYARLRAKRANGASGYGLTTALDKYSERGIKYVASLKSIMNVNNLQPLDGAKLDKTTKLVLR